MTMHLLIPEHDPNEPDPYVGDIKPGYYEGNQVVELLRQHADNPDAIMFIADMLEE